MAPLDSDRERSGIDRVHGPNEFFLGIQSWLCAGIFAIYVNTMEGWVGIREQMDLVMGMVGFQ